MPESSLIDPNDAATLDLRLDAAVAELAGTEQRMQAVLDALAAMPKVLVLVSVHDDALEPLAAARYPADRHRYHVEATDYAPAHDFFVTRVRVGEWATCSFHGGRLPPT